MNKALTGGYDWGATPAFLVHSGGDGYLRFNIRGRERNGYFEPDSNALADYREWLRGRLLEITVTNSGEPLISEILLTEDVLPGKRAQLLPDMILKWGPAESAHAISSPVIGDIRAALRTGRGGNHNADAFAASCGSRRLVEATGKLTHIGELRNMAALFFDHPDGGGEKQNRAAS